MPHGAAPHPKKEARMYNGEKRVSSLNGVFSKNWKTGHLRAKVSNWTTFSHYIHNNSKWIKDLNVKPETIKLLEENIDSMLFNISLSNIFLDLSPH